MANLHEAQLTVLLRVIEQIDIDKAMYFQPVNLTEEETELIHQIPNEYVQLTSSGIQLSPTAIDIAKEYRSVRWWAEHKNDTIYELGIDIETYSSVDLTTSGVYKYAEAEDFTILLFAYSVNGSPVMCADLASGEALPDKIKNALTDKSVLKTAFNANFERVCLSRYLGTWLEPDDWDCTMVRAARLGLPLSLAQCGAVLGLEQQKMKEGKALINYFSKPCKATKVNGGRTRNLPEHAPDKWATFKRYCIRDVEVEQAIRRKVERLNITDTERKAWLLDQRINDRGVLIDLQMAKKASDIDDEYRCKLGEEARQITGLDNPNSPVQLKAWLKAETGIDFPSIDKESVADALPRINSLKAKRILQIRQELGKTSTAKYKAMLTCACKDGRAKGLFQFYGANRSGRFAGRILQLQNLPQNHIPDIDYARNLVKNGSLDDIVLEYGNVPKLLSELIRTALIAKDGCTFHVCDFSAIEARVLAWLAGEDWVLDVFRNNGDIYCATASQMFGVPVEKHGRNAELRQKGKVATLACIAEGELVLTDKGLVPIQDVTLQHRLWNGLEWVRHEGVIFKGYKRVIKYEGLTATPDHIVYVYGQGTGKPREIQFGIAAACGSHLVQTGNGGSNIRLGENNFPREKMESRLESPLCSDRMHGLWCKAMAVLRQSKKRYVERLSVLQSNKKSYSPEVVSEKSNSAETKMPEPARSKLSFIWGARDKILFQQRLRSCRVYDKYFRFTFARFRNRPYRQQWELREGEYPICHTERKLCEQKNHGIISFRSKILGLFRGHSKAQAQSRVYKRTNNGASQTSSKGQTQGVEDHSAEVRVYDILNAEGHHCFTVSNKLVHNCGYGGGVNALKAMGADKMGLADSELADIISKYRLANPRIVRLWKHVDTATRAALRGEALPIERGITFEMKWGGMCVTLPSKRQLFYPRMHINANNRFEFEGMDQTKKVWSIQETYGGRLTENLCQSIARDILVETMLRLEKAGFNIVFHVHDETIIEATPNQKLEDIEDIFSMDIPWAKGLPLKGAGYTTPYYLKD